MTEKNTEIEKTKVNDAAKHKKKSHVVPMVIGIVAVVILVVVGIIAFRAFFVHRSVKIENYEGETVLERGGSIKDIFAGIKLVADDKVTTGEDGVAMLLVDTDKHLVASENTCFTINAAGSENSGKVTINLEYGSTLITIDNKLQENSEFEISTPNATCSVRGTTFNVAYTENINTTKVDVTDGTVHVKAGDNEIDVNAGESVTIIDELIYTSDGHIFFGRYEQDGDESNGPEPIEWEVLDDSDGSMLLVSKYILDCQPYNTTGGEITWEDCSLRSWLNDDFYNKAFSANEQDKILLTDVSNPDNAFMGINGGNDTQDKLFCLGVDDIRKYYTFEDWEDRDLSGHSSALITDATQYAKDNGVLYQTLTQDDYDEYLAGDGYELDVIGKVAGSWWLRSVGSINGDACDVTIYGTAGWDRSIGVYSEDHGVRPALYIDSAAISDALTDDSGNAGTLDVDGTDEETGNEVVDIGDGTYTRDGNYITFGHYEQDGDVSNGPEPIEWEILDEDGGRILLVSRYILDCQLYNTEYADVTWETCTLRKWLNDDFYNAAFSQAEQERVIASTISNPDNAYYGTEGGNDTIDRLFCLSVDEIRKYYSFEIWYDDYQFGYSSALITDVTPHAEDNGAWYSTFTQEDYNDYGLASEGYGADVIGRGCGVWWLRSPGNRSINACNVHYGGDAGWDIDDDVDNHGLGVRPALYIKP